jgi:hypothetical protein
MWHESGNTKVQLAVAVIAAVGTVSAALIANWDKLFRDEGQTASVEERPNDPGVPAVPEPRQPPCDTTIAFPPDNYFLGLHWTPVEEASTYTVEIDCFRCSGHQDWYSFGGTPWHVRTGLGLRTPMYSSKAHVDLKEAGGLALRWRVWAVDPDGQAGEKSEWCQLAFFGDW